MTMANIAQMIEGVGLPYAYDHFTEAEAPGCPPFICFTLPGSAHFAADGGVYQKIKTLRVELYTDEKDPETETRVEAALDGAGLYYASNESYIESERMYMVAWETQVMMD